MSKGVDEGNKDGILRGMTQENEEDYQEKERRKKGLWGNKEAKNLSNCRTLFLCITDSNTPFRHPFEEPPFWKGGVHVWKLAEFTLLNPPKTRKRPKQLCAPKPPFFKIIKKSQFIGFLLKNPFLANSTLFSRYPCDSVGLVQNRFRASGPK